MAGRKMLPVGIENFEEIRKDNFYYIDKTKLIEQLLTNRSKVKLFTRPRRFGKTLNMSMLKCFFEIGTDRTLFDGLYISKNRELCEKYMGKYPVIFLTLKGVEGLTFEVARNRMVELIGGEARRFQFLLDSDNLSTDDKGIYRTLITHENGKYAMDDSALASSLKTLSELLYKHYGQKTVILIDEYDVPLDKAFSQGYYREMVSLIRGIFGDALKTNDYLQFAVLTGCLRVSKESIFTGLNNFKAFSTVDVRYEEEFGFTDQEVRDILTEYGLQEHFNEAKEWYDGYRFGNADIYCPWDVINYADDLLCDPNAKPQTYWINSSGNVLVKRFVERADQTTKNEIERLIAGEAVEKDIRLDLTYDEIDNSIENIWSVLFTTGYLTQTGMTDEGAYKLIIPNKEVKEVYRLQIREWFREVSRNDGKTLEQFCNAFPEKNPEKIEELLGDYLWKTISIRDTASAKKENFYHGILLGLLGYKGDWLLRSNAESGIGYSDILVEVPDNRTGIVIELKYAENGDMDAACEQALRQIEERDYAARLREDGMRGIIRYGIACYKKNCKVVLG